MNCTGERTCALCGTNDKEFSQFYDNREGRAIRYFLCSVCWHEVKFCMSRSEELAEEIARGGISCSDYQYGELNRDFDALISREPEWLYVLYQPRFSDYARQRKS